jgi:hypothetical protein
MTHHPHVHMIVPGGGLSDDGSRWVSARSNFLVHVNVLARLFRGKFLAMLSKAHAEGQLKFFNAHAQLTHKRSFKRFLVPLRRSKWVVYCKDPFAGPEQVLRYQLYPPRRHMTTVSPSAGRTIASTVPAGGRR